MAEAPNLRAARRFRPAVAGPSLAERRHMGRVIGALFVAGAALGALSLMLPNPSPHRGVLMANVSTAAVVGGLLLLYRRPVPMWVGHGATAVGTAMVSVAVYFSGDTDSIYAVLFVWVVLLAAYYFPGRHMWAHLAWLVTAYGVTLIMLEAHPQDFSPVTRWIVTTIALAISGFFVSALVEQRRRAEQADRRLAAIVDCSQDAIMSTDLNGRLTSWNAGAEAMYGYTPEEAIGQPISMLAPPDRPEESSTLLEHVKGGHNINHYETVRKRADGSLVDVSMAISPIRDEDGQVVGASAVARDITARRQLENDRQQLLAKVRSLARTDALTGLANRRAWDDELDRELARARRLETHIVVALLDLDHFKRFNDEHGHLAGDELLKEAAECWQTTVRSTDFVARYGGEEFAVLLTGCTYAEALETVERLRGCVPMGQTCSAGVASWDGEESATMLTGRADEALYEAKRGGRDQVRVAPAPAGSEAVAR